MAKILIVDDSPSQLLGIQRIVEKLGHESITAEDGAAGVEVAKRELPDMVLMDVVMPNLNGFQATRTWGLRQGAKAYLTKPFSEDELAEVIERIFNARELPSPPAA